MGRLEGRALPGLEGRELPGRGAPGGVGLLEGLELQGRGAPGGGGCGRTAFVLDEDVPGSGVTSSVRGMVGIACTLEEGVLAEHVTFSEDSEDLSHDFDLAVSAAGTDPALLDIDVPAEPATCSERLSRDLEGRPGAAGLLVDAYGPRPGGRP